MNDPLTPEQERRTALADDRAFNAGYIAGRVAERTALAAASPDPTEHPDPIVNGVRFVTGRAATPAEPCCYTWEGHDESEPHPAPAEPDHCSDCGKPWPCQHRNANMPDRPAERDDWDALVTEIREATRTMSDIYVHNGAQAKRLTRAIDRIHRAVAEYANARLAETDES